MLRNNSKQSGESTSVLGARAESVQCAPRFILLVRWRTWLVTNVLCSETTTAKHVGNKNSKSLLRQSAFGSFIKTSSKFIIHILLCSLAMTYFNEAVFAPLACCVLG